MQTTLSTQPRPITHTTPQGAADAADAKLQGLAALLADIAARQATRPDPDEETTDDVDIQPTEA